MSKKVTKVPSMKGKKKNSPSQKKDTGSKQGNLLTGRIDENLPKNQKEYIAQQVEKDQRKKPAKTREQILNRLHNVLSLAAKTPRTSPNLSGNYGPINTTDLIVWLCAKKGYKLIGEAEQIVRRNWKRYQSDASYRREIDEKQAMAKHCVLLSNAKNGDGLHYPNEHQIILMNDYKGGMALKVYMGIFTMGVPSLYRVSFNTIEDFQSLRHTWNNAGNIQSIMVDALKDLQKNRKEESKKLYTTYPNAVIKQYLENFFSFLKQENIKIPDYKLKGLREMISRDDKDTSLLMLKTWVLTYVVNYQVLQHRHASVGTLDKRAKLALKISQWFNEL